MHSAGRPVALRVSSCSSFKLNTCCKPLQELLGCLKALLKLDKAWIPNRPGHSMYVRPYMFSHDGALGVHRSSASTLAVIMSPVGPYFKSGEQQYSSTAGHGLVGVVIRCLRDAVTLPSCSVCRLSLSPCLQHVRVVHTG
jgi:hypothetical protein